MNFGAMGDERVQDVFRRVDAELFEAAGLDGIGILGAVSQERLDTLAADPAFVASLYTLRDDVQRSLAAPHWFQLRHEGELDLVAYFSPEFGLAEALPMYSGGLGILAGDHLKAASDLGIPLVGLGLFYHYGYMQQTIDRTGWQRERFREQIPRDMALSPVTDARITIDLAGVPTGARVWRVDVGRVQLYLLDSDVSENDEFGCSVTDRLYGGDTEQRIRQEILLGVGGVRLLEALGLRPQVFHMNEGHAAFLALERIRRAISDDGLRFEEAVEATRPAQVFTTHTPVPAGIDRFPRALIERYFTEWADECGVTIDTLMELGHEPGTEPGKDLNLAAMALRLAGAANGVSRIHGAVSRQMFSGIWPALARRRDADRVGDQRRPRPHLGVPRDGRPPRPPARFRLARSRRRALAAPRRGVRRRAVGDPPDRSRTTRRLRTASDPPGTDGARDARGGDGVVRLDPRPRDADHRFRATVCAVQAGNSAPAATAIA